MTTIAKPMTPIRVITNSEREKFACERLWFFSSIEGLTTHNTPAPFRHGTIVHAGVDFIVDHQQLGVLTTREMIWTHIVEPWLARRSETDGARNDYEEDKEFAELATSMLEGYAQHWHHEDQTIWQWTEYEMPVARMILHPVTHQPLCDTVDVNGKKQTRLWVYAGKIDKLGVDRMSGSMWLSEIKTTTSNNLADYCAKLDWDRQTRGYAWALRDPYPYSETAQTSPIHVDGVCYDVLRKAAPSPPEMLKRGRLSVAKTLTTRALYERTIHEHKLDPDDYREHLEKLGGLEQFFHRVRYPFSDVEVEAFGQEIGWVALRMMQAEREPFHPPQTRLCRSGPHATGCPGGFDQLCIEDGPMARMGFHRMQIRHAELPLPLCEPVAREQVSPTGFIKIGSKKTNQPSTTTTPKPVDDDDIFGEPADAFDVDNEELF